MTSCDNGCSSAAKFLWLAIPILYVLLFKIASAEAARPDGLIPELKHKKILVAEDNNPRINEIKDVESSLKKNRLIRQFNSLTDLMYEVYIQNPKPGKRYRSLSGRDREAKLRCVKIR